MRNPPNTTEALRTLLERMFPDTEISGAGVALLAAQMAELEDHWELVHNRNDHTPNWAAGLSMVETYQLMPPNAGRVINYEPDNYAE